MRLRMQPCTADDLASLARLAATDTLLADARPAPTPGWSWSYWLDADLVACGGLELIGWPGVAQSWLLLRPMLAQFVPVALALRTAKTLRQMIRTHGLWRVEANVHRHFPQAVRLVQGLGFRCEGIRHDFGPDAADYFLFAWLRRDHPEIDL